ncbi:MAG: long-chain-fatty-acid--CoA ligase [Thermodesulfobacteriota bacterium]
MPEKSTFPQYNKHYPLLVKNFLKRPLFSYPDDMAMVYRNDAGEYFRFTWRQWHQRTCQLAHALKSLGVQEGDRIATMALNHHRHMEIIYASICTGAVSHPINIRLSLDHMAFTITHAEDLIIFFDDLLLPLVEILYDRIKPSVKKFVYLSDKPGLPKTKIEPLYEYEELIKDQPTGYEWPDLDEDTKAVLYYTTGTTGLPKGVMYTNRQIYLHTIHNIAMVGMAVRLPDDPIRPNQAIPMMNVPLFHIHAWGAPFTNVYSCAKIVFPGRFTPESFCELVQTEKVNGAMMVPTMLAMLLEYPDLGKWDLSSLLLIGIGGGALPLGLKRKAEKLFPNMRTGSGYGMTETMAGAVGASIRRHMVNWPKEEIDKVLVKTGLPHVPAIDARVIDENGNDIPHDNETIGEIVLRGHWIMEEYYKDPEKTAAAWREGWFHTGDAAKIDTDGYIIIADRITDVIRSGSEMVPTVLLENLTSNADYVLEATYVGVPDEKWGEIPMAVVKLMQGAEQKEEDVLEFLQKEGVEKGKITKWMLPVYVAFVDEIPKTSVGKYDKIAVRKRMDEFVSKAKKVRLT